MTAARIDMDTVARARILLVAIALLAPTACGAADEGVTISSATRDQSGFLVHEVTCPFQAGKTQVRLLLPDDMDANRRYPVVYVLPVEPGTQHRFGDGLVEVKQHDLANRYGAIFVAPTFSHLPWYADHPTDPTIRQETYFIEVVIPLVEQAYPAKAEPRGRLLLGFSKSGWGAWTLLLRHPDLFGRAAAWDSPMTMDHSGPFGSGEIFGTQENFEKYEVSRLLRDKAAALGTDTRLILMGKSAFAQEHEQMHALLDELRIRHQYRDGPVREHNWHSGWVDEAVVLLLAPADRSR